jgi:uncharacterized protein YaaN involved in tellurite resistance
MPGGKFGLDGSSGATILPIGKVWRSLYSSAQQFTATAQTELRQERQRANERLEALERKLKDFQQASEASQPHSQRGSAAISHRHKPALSGQ